MECEEDSGACMARAMATVLVAAMAWMEQQPHVKGIPRVRSLVTVGVFELLTFWERREAG